jgi:hypothetical protein
VLTVILTRSGSSTSLCLDLTALVIDKDIPLPYSALPPSPSPLPPRPDTPHRACCALSAVMMATARVRCCCCHTNAISHTLLFAIAPAAGPTVTACNCTVMVQLCSCAWNVACVAACVQGPSSCWTCWAQGALSCPMPSALLSSIQTLTNQSVLHVALAKARAFTCASCQAGQLPPTLCSTGSLPARMIPPHTLMHDAYSTFIHGCAIKTLPCKACCCCQLLIPTRAALHSAATAAP